MDHSSNAVEEHASAFTTSQKHWTIREQETDVLHGKLLGKGGFGEVHEVSGYFPASLTESTDV